jgi:hypothetical protein
LNASFWGESPPEGLVCGLWMGDSERDDDEVEVPRRRPRMGEGVMVWVGRTAGERDAGSWAVRRTGASSFDLVCGEAEPLSCARHS